MTKHPQKKKRGEKPKKIIRSKHRSKKINTERPEIVSLDYFQSPADKKVDEPLRPAREKGKRFRERKSASL